MDGATGHTVQQIQEPQDVEDASVQSGIAEGIDEKQSTSTSSSLGGHQSAPQENATQQPDVTDIATTGFVPPELLNDSRLKTESTHFQHQVQVDVLVSNTKYVSNVKYKDYVLTASEGNRPASEPNMNQQSSPQTLDLHKLQDASLLQEPVQTQDKSLKYVSNVKYKEYVLTASGGNRPASEPNMNQQSSPQTLDLHKLQDASLLQEPVQTQDKSLKYVSNVKYKDYVLTASEGNRPASEPNMNQQSSPQTLDLHKLQDASLLQEPVQTQDKSLKYVSNVKYKEYVLTASGGNRPASEPNMNQQSFPQTLDLHKLQDASLLQEPVQTQDKSLKYVSNVKYKEYVLTASEGNRPASEPNMNQQSSPQTLDLHKLQDASLLQEPVQTQDKSLKYVSNVKYKEYVLTASGGNRPASEPNMNQQSSSQTLALHKPQDASLLQEPVQTQDKSLTGGTSEADENATSPSRAQHPADEIEVMVEVESHPASQNEPVVIERSASDTELCNSSNVVKGIDLDAVFSKSTECISVPARQNNGDNDFSKRPHHHREPMMRSRTLSVVSLLSTHGAAKFRLSKSQKLTLFCLCLVNFTSYISYSVIAPFYPQEATYKGMREAVSGFVFSVYALTMMVFAPIFGKLVPILGAKFIFFTGILCAGGANILFGLLDMAQDTLVFTVMSFLVRILEAVGAAGFCTASYSIVLHVYPDHISTVFGIIETCVGVGMSIGPAIGGALYSVGGFGLPFYILGCCVLLTFPVCWIIMKDIQVQAKETRTESYFTLLRIPQVIIVSIILVIGSQSQGFVEPTLEPHMRQEFDVDTSIVGSFFLVMSAIFSICSPLVGLICMKTEQRIPIMISGLIIMAAAQLLMGPAPFLGIPSNLWATLATVAVLGASFAFAYVPTMESMIRAATSGGMKEDIGTYALVSGWWNAMYSLGEVIGPSAGGVLLDLIGFPWASTVVAGGSLLTAFIATLYWCCASRTEPESFWHEGQPSSSSSVEDSDSVVSEPLGETTALLGKKKKDLQYNSL
ncbi:uncharacterized protein LOC144129148 [Amblyomma americanum]